MTTYVTVAEHNNAAAFAGTWEYIPNVGGRHINRNGAPALNVAHAHAVEGGLTADQTDKIGRQVTAFCGEAHRLYIDEQKVKNRPPRLFLTLDEKELETAPSENIITVEVKCKDGKTARVSLVIGNSALNGLFATISAPARKSDHSQTLRLRPADWSE